MKNIMYEHTEARLKAYFESLVIKESLRYRQSVLQKHKGALEVLEYSDNVKDQLTEVKTQILKLDCNIRLLEKEFSDVEFALSTLSDRDRQIAVSRYRDKKTYMSIGFAHYLSESRVHQIRCRILKYLYNKLSL